MRDERRKMANGPWFPLREGEENTRDGRSSSVGEAEKSVRPKPVVERRNLKENCLKPLKFAALTMREKKRKTERHDGGRNTAGDGVNIS